MTEAGRIVALVHEKLKDVKHNFLTLITASSKLIYFFRYL